MQIKIISQAIFMILLIISVSAFGGTGRGEVKAGYTFIDETGNRAVNHSTFNLYEGLNLSLEKFGYNFDNGIRMTADLKRITLNNRNLSIGAGKSGLFGLHLNNNQYRRIYNSEGSGFTRRHTTSGSFYVYPHRYIKIFGGGSYIGRSGKTVDLMSLGNPMVGTAVDYVQKQAYGGAQINYRGSMLNAEYGGIDYVNHKNSNLDQSRSWVKLLSIASIPEYEWVVLSAGYRHYQTEYLHKDIAISSNKVHAGTRLRLPQNFTLSYNFIFDRTASDSDKIATDNIGHTFYVSHLWPTLAGLTVGYQYNTTDDYEDIVKSNAYFFSGWLKPAAMFEFRGEYGFRAEEVDEGSRFVGDEDRNRFKISGKYRNPDYGSIRLKFETKTRTNDQLGSKLKFSRTAVDADIAIPDYGQISAGYSYSMGDYTDIEETFKFRDHQVYADLISREYYNLTGGAGIVYYRSRRDLDIESINLNFSISYRFLEINRLELNYNADNFDDFLVNDLYYTSNIVEINLIRNLSF